MKLLIQRVSSASVSVDSSVVSEIEKGLCVFIGFCREDSESVIETGVKKMLNLRIFEDEKNKMNRSVKDINGEILCVSQFTLCSDVQSGNRPGFDSAMESEKAGILFDRFCETASKEIKTKRGVFKSLMDVRLVNHGPATFILELK